MKLNIRAWLHRGGSAYDRVVFACIWAATFLIPLFFLPFSTDPLELNKAYLFTILVLIGTVVWLLKFVLTRDGAIRRSGMELPLVIFAIVSILATAFSAYPFRSLVGTSGDTAQSLMSTVSFILFFFLVLNVIRREQLPWIFGSLMLSTAVLGIFNFLQVFGIFLFHSSFAQIATFNAIANSTSAFSVFFALTTLLAFVKLLRCRNPWIRVATLVIFFLNLFLLLVYDRPIGWYVLIVGLILVVVFLNLQSKRPSASQLLLPTLLMGFVIIALVVNTQALLRANIPGDVSLPLTTGRMVAWQSIQHAPFLGSGQGTFDVHLSKYRPILFNDSSVWNLRFVRSTNVWFQLLSTIGVIGTLAFAFLVLWTIKRLFSTIFSIRRDHPSWWYYTGVFTALVCLTIASAMMSFSFTLTFLMWLFLAAAAVLLRAERGEAKSVTKSVTQKPTTSFATSLLFSLALVVAIVVGYYSVRFWVADFDVSRANAAVQRQQDLGQVQNYFTWSLDLNPYEQGAYFDLSQSLLVQAQLLAQEKNPDLNKLRALITTSVAAAQTGTAKYPQSAASYEALSALYQSVDALTGGESAETKAAFLKAIELDPRNPKMQMNLGQYYLALARSQAQQANAGDKPDQTLLTKARESIESARQAFLKAVELKSDYIDAELNIALAMRVQGKGADAVAYLEDLAAKNPFNTDALFNLSENYLIDNQQEKAQAVLLRVVSIFPGYSDAHTRLATIYEGKGDIAKAINELQIVDQLNPGIKEVTDKIADLRTKLK